MLGGEGQHAGRGGGSMPRMTVLKVKQPKGLCRGHTLRTVLGQGVPQMTLQGWVNSSEVCWGRSLRPGLSRRYAPDDCAGGREALRTMLGGEST